MIVVEKWYIGRIDEVGIPSYITEDGSLANGKGWGTSYASEDLAVAALNKGVYYDGERIEGLSVLKFQETLMEVIIG